MSIIHFHTPQGIVSVDSESPTLADELAALGVAMEEFEKLLPKKYLQCAPGSLNPPQTGIPEQVDYILNFLKEICG